MKDCEKQNLINQLMSLDDKHFIDIVTSCFIYKSDELRGFKLFFRVSSAFTCFVATHKEGGTYQQNVMEFAAILMDEIIDDATRDKLTEAMTLYRSKKAQGKW
jgi:hypothetical protein